jgi:hypothetical protein
MTLAKLVTVCFVVLASPYAVTQDPVAARPPAEYASVNGNAHHRRCASAFAARFPSIILDVECHYLPFVVAPGPR